jgi:hypothetical protein
MMALLRRGYERELGLGDDSLRGRTYVTRCGALRQIYYEDWDICGCWRQSRWVVSRHEYTLRGAGRGLAPRRKGTPDCTIRPVYVRLDGVLPLTYSVVPA